LPIPSFINQEVETRKTFFPLTRDRVVVTGANHRPRIPLYLPAFKNSILSNDICERILAQPGRTPIEVVHSDLGNDARPHLAVLPAIEREDRALAQIAQRGVQFGQEHHYRSMLLGVL
jgi:hypothetical protein